MEIFVRGYYSAHTIFVSQTFLSENRSILAEQDSSFHGYRAWSVSGSEILKFECNFTLPYEINVLHQVSHTIMLKIALLMCCHKTIDVTITVLVHKET